MPGDDLVDPSGRPLIPEPKVAVVKTSRNTPPPGQRQIQAIAQITGCSVIVLPMDSEFVMGGIAAKEIDSIHHAVHAISEIPDVTFTKEELGTLYAAMRFLCEKTEPGNKSKEVTLLKRIKPLTE